MAIDIELLQQQLKDLETTLQSLKLELDLEAKRARLIELNKMLSDQANWQDVAKQAAWQKECNHLQDAICEFEQLTLQRRDLDELLELAAAENDQAVLLEVQRSVEALSKGVKEQVFKQRFDDPADFNDAYVDIQAGSGGTEAQDWAQILERMYLKFGDRHGFKPQILEQSAGEVAGIKSATLKFSGAYAYGWLRTETGVHRLVRKSPFDANHKRHTSFASVFVYPQVDDTVKIEINPADLTVDTYRAQGAGGQHVNKTESAVRITHAPSGIVVQCQSERSQQQNRLQAMQQLRAKLYERELRKQHQKQAEIEASKLDITWGSQIRSYVLDDARVKDTRTGFESRNPLAVLNGELDEFIEESLKLGKASKSK